MIRPVRAQRDSVQLDMAHNTRATMINVFLQQTHAQHFIFMLLHQLSIRLSPIILGVLEGKYPITTMLISIIVGIMMMVYVTFVTSIVRPAMAHFKQIA